MKGKLFLLVIAFCLLLVTACAPPTTSDSGGSTSITITSPDTTAPVVSSTDPTNNQNSVDLSKVISVTFNETMKASSITSTTFSIDKGVTGTVSCNSSTATFTPNSNLSPSTTYTVTITTGVTDTADNALAANYSWSFTTNSGSSGTWSFVADMIQDRAAHTATLLKDGRVLVVGGGETMIDPLSNCQIYNPITNSWSNTGDLNIARVGHEVVLLNDGRVLVTGGYNESYSPPRLTSCEIYDTTTGSWTQTANIENGGTSHTATLLNDGRVLVVGGSLGETGIGYDPAFYEIFNPTTDTWSPTNMLLNSDTSAHTAVLLNDGGVLVAGGQESGNLLLSCEIYDSTTGSWSFTGDINQARRYEMTDPITLLSDGRVLITGGEGDSGNYLSSCELYYPATGTWSMTDSLSQPTHGHTISLLDSGNVILVGGEDGNNNFYTTCEIFNKTTNTWSSASSLNTGRATHTATKLDDGRVLVVGGTNGIIFLSSCEIYQP